MEDMIEGSGEYLDVDMGMEDVPVDIDETTS